MNVNFGLLGWFFNVIGFTFLFLAFFTPRHQKIHNEKWTKSYWWNGWRPIFKIRPPNEKAYWMIKWNSKPVRCGAIPPQHQWNIIGLFYTFIGFYLQFLTRCRCTSKILLPASQRQSRKRFGGARI